MSQASCIGERSAGEPVRPREIGVPSDGSEEAVAPKVPPVPAKPTQAEQDEHHATAIQPIVRGVSIVSKVEDVHLHTRLFPKESRLKLESTMPILDRKDPK